MNQSQQFRTVNAIQQQLNSTTFHGFTGGSATVRLGTANGQTIAELVLEAGGQYSQIIPGQLTLKDNRTFTSTATSTATVLPQEFCFKQSRNGKLMLDAATMTEPVEEPVSTSWPGGTAPNVKVAEYLSGLRQFLKLSATTEGKRRLGDIKIVTQADGTRLFCCPMCNMAYPDKTLLEPHLASHKIERRWVCDVCGAGLKRKEHLDRHQLSHSDERPYSCAACPKTFKRNEHLARHYVVHSGEKAEMEKRFICGICGAAHARREHLERHRTSHSDERPHECPACLKTFKRQEHLARHMLTHAGIKPHVCHICTKAFYRKDHLRKHAAAHQLRQLKVESDNNTSAATVVQETPIQPPGDKLALLIT